MIRMTKGGEYEITNAIIINRTVLATFLSLSSAAAACCALHCGTLFRWSLLTLYIFKWQAMIIEPLTMRNTVVMIPANWYIIVAMLKIERKKIGETAVVIIKLDSQLTMAPRSSFLFQHTTENSFQRQFQWSLSVWDQYQVHSNSEGRRIFY